MTDPTILEVVGTVDHGALGMLGDDAVVVRNDDEFLLVEETSGEEGEG